MILGLEGPSYGGKTSALGQLRWVPAMQGAMIFPCYVKSFTRREDIPTPSTQSADEQVEAFMRFMEIEANRVHGARQRGGLIVLDRTVDTLLAHAHAMDELYGFGVLPELRRRVQELPHLRPDHTLYLDVAPELLHLRRKAAGHHELEPEYFLHDPAFLSHFRDYFCHAAHRPVAREMAVADGDGDRQETAAVVQALFTYWAGR
ncbi:hypothetical protein [Streptomyces sp. CBMA152]|uniref:hypothetical protein n=1 Tax=Streptomyces sp. CBMA152 TaxID=1896312 RepID=UPI00166097D8|nr:hypothetical protein [Streptomyces sp. CBMA152]MBD0743977.1 hypothetical protein [Streptomyces sp. CBMA152]